MTSESIAWPIGNSIPMPMPSSTRNIMSVPTSGAKAHRKLPAPHSTMLDWNTTRRPKRSASRPELAAPTSMPRKLALPSRPACTVLRPNSALIEPRMKVIIPRSMESNSHAVAMIMNSVC